MFRLLKMGIIASLLSFLYLPSTQAACYYRCNNYYNERPAWGGNGGSWGNVHSDWHGEYGWPERGNCDYACSRCYNPYFSPFCYNNYCSRSHYRPYPQYKYVDDSVDGAGLYFFRTRLR